MKSRYRIDSSRSPDLIQSNFRKLCRENSQDSSYALMSGDKTVATFHVTLQPQGTMTKTMVLARVPLAPDGNYRINAVAKAADMQHVVLDIINAP